jgi:hypothetical protein
VPSRFILIIGQDGIRYALRPNQVAVEERARLPTWRLWTRDDAIEKKDLLKARLHLEPRRVRATEVLYCDVADADKAAEVSWLRANVMGPDQGVWALRVAARDRYSDRCWSWGERLDIGSKGAADRPGGRWNGVMTPDVVGEGQDDTLV